MSNYKKKSTRTKNLVDLSVRKSNDPYDYSNNARMRLRIKIKEITSDENIVNAKKETIKEAMIVIKELQHKHRLVVHQFHSIKNELL